MSIYYDYLPRKFIRWNNGNVMSFKDNINLEDLCSLENELDILLELDDVVNAKDNIISCVSKAIIIIISSANLSGMVKDNNVYKKKKKENKPWFDNLEISTMKQGMCIEIHI